MAKKSYFTKALFKFLTELKKNNNREWFQANKARFESDVRDPILGFITDFGAPLSRISQHLVADPRPVGGSLFRIYRDTRFSKDKTPYKTNMGAHFRHVEGKEAHAPGYYLHLEPGGCFTCAGIWHPEGEALKQIRNKIASSSEAWRKVNANKKIRETFGPLEGESLVRPPKGYDPEHPFIEDIKRKDFIVMAPLSEDQITGAEFMELFASQCRTAAPLLEFLTSAVDLPF